MDLSKLNDEGFELLKKAVEKKLAWKNAEEWQHQDFILLSEKILEATGVNLSQMTLKRAWGKVTYKGNTSKTTKDALANYLGFEDFLDYLNKTMPFDASLIEDTATAKTAPHPKKQIHKTWVLILAIAFATGITGGVILYKNKKPSLTVSPKNITLKVYNATDTVPHKFGLKYHLHKHNPANFKLKVDFLLNNKLSAQQDSLMLTYLLPGFAYAKIYHNGAIIKADTIFTKTNGWQAFYVDRTNHINFKKISLTKPNQNHLAITTQQLAKAGFDTLTDHYVSINNFKYFGINGQAAQLTCQVKNPYRPTAISTGTIHIALWGTNGLVDIHICDPGKAFLLKQTLNGKTITHKMQDLTNFTTNTQNWTKLKITLKKQTCQVNKNSKNIADFTLPQSIGQIVGIQFNFKGLGGEVRNVHLKPL